VKKGSAAKELEWVDANKRAQKKADAERATREAAGREAATALQHANQTASDWQARYRKEARRGIPLAVCPNPAATPRQPGSVDPPTDRGLRLTYAFLRDYDAGWTGYDGKPLFGDTGGAAGPIPEAGAPSEAGLEELLDTHATNAGRCSANARQLDRLTTLIRKLREIPSTGLDAGRGERDLAGLGVVNEAALTQLHEDVAPETQALPAIVQVAAELRNAVPNAALPALDHPR
jgi:hypothetical protein